MLHLFQEQVMPSAQQISITVSLACLIFVPQLKPKQEKLILGPNNANAVFVCDNNISIACHGIEPKQAKLMPEPKQTVRYESKLA